MKETKLIERKAKEFFIAAIEYFGFEIKKMQTDNGCKFLGEFEKFLQKKDTALI